MKWYYKVMGGHTHVRVFMNGSKCGDLCFRNEEWEIVTHDLRFNRIVEFIEEHDSNEAIHVETTIPMRDIPQTATMESLMAVGFSEANAKTLIEARDRIEG